MVAPGPSFEYVNTVTIVGGVATLDLARSSHFAIVQPSAAFAVAVTNVPTGDYVVDLYVRITTDSAVTVTWPLTFSGAPSVFEASAVQTIHLQTWDAGSSFAPAAGATARYAADVGDGAELSFTVTHGLGSEDATVHLRDLTTGEWVVPHATVLNSNQTRLDFEEIPAVNQYRAVFGR